MINTDIVFLDLNLQTKKEIIDFLIKKLKEHNYLSSSSKDFKNKILYLILFALILTKRKNL